MSLSFRSALADATGLGARNRILLALLRKYEWTAIVGGHCMGCSNYESNGHDVDCDIGNALEGD